MPDQRYVMLVQKMPGIDCCRFMTALTAARPKDCTLRYPGFKRIVDLSQLYVQ